MFTEDIPASPEIWMKLRRVVLVAACLAFLSAGARFEAPPSPTLLVLTNANIIDGVSDLPIRGATLVVRNGKIASVTSQPLPIPSGASVLDLKGMWLLPGLIDAHVHLGDLASASHSGSAPPSWGSAWRWIQRRRALSPPAALQEAKLPRARKTACTAWRRTRKKSATQVVKRTRRLMPWSRRVSAWTALDCTVLQVSAPFGRSP
jgi:hypothetical protein